MAVDDLWFLKRRGADGKPIPADRHGRGMRWRVRYTDPAGKSKTKMFERKADADRFDAESRHTVATGTYIGPDAGRITFRAYAEQWRAAQRHRVGSRDRVETTLRRHVYPAIGDMSLRDIRPLAVQAMLTDRAKVLGASGLDAVMTWTRAVFLSAVDDGLIVSSPITRRIKVAEPVKKIVVPWPIEAVQLMRGEMVEEFDLFVDIAAMAGLRFGEALGLEVEHFRPFKRELVVAQQWIVPAKGEDRRCYLGAPKTASSRRTIPIGRELTARIAAHLAKFPPTEVEVPDRTDPGRPKMRRVRMILTEKGVPARPWALRHAFTTAAKRCLVGLVEQPHPHDLRHFYASALIAHGASVVQVQKRLGHATAKETLDTYAHMWRTEDDATRNIIDGLFGSAPTLGVVPPPVAAETDSDEESAA